MQERMTNEMKAAIMAGEGKAEFAIWDSSDSE